MKDALEAARVARFTDEEWDAYIRAGMAIQDERGALSLARKQGLKEGKQDALRAMRAALTEMLRQRGLAPGPQEQARLEECEDLETLQRWLVQALSATSATEALR